jgi:hypothetical protein
VGAGEELERCREWTLEDWEDEDGRASGGGRSSDRGEVVCSGEFGRDTEDFKALLRGTGVDIAVSKNQDNTATIAFSWRRQRPRIQFPRCSLEPEGTWVSCLRWGRRTTDDEWRRTAFVGIDGMQAKSHDSVSFLLPR